MLVEGCDGEFLAFSTFCNNQNYRSNGNILLWSKPCSKDGCACPLRLVLFPPGNRHHNQLLINFSSGESPPLRPTRLRPTQDRGSFQTLMEEAIIHTWNLLRMLCTLSVEQKCPCGAILLMWSNLVLSPVIQM